MSRKSVLFTVLAMTVLVLSGCTDETARKSNSEQASTIQELNAKISELQGDMKDLKKRMSDTQSQGESVDDSQRDFETRLLKKIQGLKNSQQGEFVELNELMVGLQKDVQARADEDREMNDKLKEGMLYQQNTRTEMETYLKNRMEEIVVEIIDNKLQEVYPYAYYKKRY